MIARANTGEEALDWLQSFSPHLILLDVFLPDILGVDLIDKINEISPTSSIILITAATEAHIVQKAYLKNVTDYILKPFTFNQLKESIEKFRYKHLLLQKNEKFTQEKFNIYGQKHLYPFLKIHHYYRKALIQQQ